MDQTEQQYIDALFDRLQGAERESGPRDAGAERYIRDVIARQPNAPYYMTQALIIQDEALKAAQQRITDLEREIEERPAQQTGGGFLGGLFGGGANPTRGTSVPQTGSVPRAGGFSYPRDDRAAMEEASAGRYGQPAPARGGGGFLAGALQTATGVAGGVVLGNVIGNLLGGHEAFGGTHTAEAAKSEHSAAQPEEHHSDQTQSDQNDPFANVENTQYDDDDSIVGGDFDGGDDYDI
jgi:hypothetical protein